MAAKSKINPHAFFLFYLDSICDLMGCEMAKGMLQRIGESVAKKVVEKFGEESLHVSSLEELTTTSNPLSYFDDSLQMDDGNLLILEKYPFF